jgi:GR25 family glycosyltransferase involved in LPS biosynthesis
MRAQLPPAFVINLRDRVVRLETFREAAAIAGISCQQFNAVDTRTPALLHSSRKFVCPAAWDALVASRKRGHRQAHAELSAGAVGCALSHVAVSNMCLNELGLPVACVFEDDAAIPHDAADIMTRALEQASLSAPTWEMVLLGWWDRGGATPLENGGTGELVRVGHFWGCHAYLLSARGMARLMELNTPVTAQIDAVLSQSSHDMQILGIADRGVRFKQQPSKGSDVQFPVRLARPT